MSYCGERTKWISGFYHAQAVGSGAAFSAMGS